MVLGGAVLALIALGLLFVQRRAALISAPEPSVQIAPVSLLSVQSAQPYTQSAIYSVNFRGLWNKAGDAVSSDPSLVITLHVTNGTDYTMQVSEIYERPVIDGIKCSHDPRIGVHQFARGTFGVPVEMTIAYQMAKETIEKLVRMKRIEFNLTNVRLLVSFPNDGIKPFQMAACDSIFEVDLLTNEISVSHPEARLERPILFGLGPKRQ
jgi:LEA14-like dessication related protein